MAATRGGRLYRWDVSAEAPRLSAGSGSTGLGGEGGPALEARFESRFCQISDHAASQARDLVIERAAVRLGEGCLAAPDGAGLYVVV